MSAFKQDKQKFKQEGRVMLGGRAAVSFLQMLAYAFTNCIVGRVTLFKQKRAEFKNELHLFRVGASYRF